VRTEPRASRYLRATALARGTIPVLLVSGAIACGPIATAGPGCSPVRTGLALPPELKESSGVAVSLRHPGISGRTTTLGRPSSRSTRRAQFSAVICWTVAFAIGKTSRYPCARTGDRAFTWRTWATTTKSAKRRTTQ